MPFPKWDSQGMGEQFVEEGKLIGGPVPCDHCFLVNTEIPTGRIYKFQCAIESVRCRSRSGISRICAKSKDKQKERWQRRMEKKMGSIHNPPEFIIEAGYKKPLRTIYIALGGIFRSKIYFCEFSNAWSKSAMISSMFSMPTDTRTNSGVTPDAFWASGLICWWLVEAG